MPRINAKRFPARALRPLNTSASNPQTAIVLQGGGALGAYQGGVYETLTRHEHAIDWVVGTSIGAINGAIIAGNPPERRVDRLRAFWHQVGRDDALAPFSLNPFTANPLFSAWIQPWADAGALLETMTRGIPGFFEPRGNGIPNIHQDVPTKDAGFYDTAPLHATLERLVDFDYLNERHVRCTVCAVDVASGELVVFDSKKERLSALHIMASGALPPGFPPIEIKGRVYWDGGIYSNTPVDIVMDDAERKDTLCFMVDLWDPTEDVPRSISGAMARQKAIQYASRSREHLDDHRTMHNMRRAIELLARRLPAKDRADPALKGLVAHGCKSTLNIVRLVMKARLMDGPNRDIDFGRSALDARWTAGAHDAERALKYKRWLDPVPADVGMVIHELVQEEGDAR